LPGVEYLSEDGDLPGEWVFSLAASLQRVYEPPC
jgi:hypothetical protein